MPSAGFHLVSDTLRPGIARFPERLDSALAAIAEYHAPQMESYAKAHAPWNDQTGNARGTLHAFAEHAGFVHKIWLAHGMPYGLWLEVRWGGKYAIINPTLQRHGPEVMKTVREVMKRMKS